MKKKALLLASIGVLACAVGVTALAFGGANQLDRLQVKADDPIGPKEYSVTFDAESESTTVENPYGNGNYAICTTTARGNKLGVAGRSYYYAPSDRLYFGEAAHFGELELHDDSNALKNAGANDIKHITGYQIFFTGGSLFLR